MCVSSIRLLTLRYPSTRVFVCVPLCKSRVLLRVFLSLFFIAFFYAPDSLPPQQPPPQQSFCWRFNSPPLEDWSSESIALPVCLTAG